MCQQASTTNSSRSLRSASLRVVVAQCDTTEGDVARLVLHDIGVDGGRERVLRLVADALEGRQCQALDQDLHGQIGHVPAAVAEPLLEQGFEPMGDRVGELELLVQKPRIGLDMARLVHDLGGGVEF
jgi:hypothetical protein